MNYQPKTFTVPALNGISEKSIEEHIGLYQGYVKNFNAISDTIDTLLSDPEKNMHAIAELVRRRSFEFDGMRLHELYFPQFEGSASALSEQGKLATALTTQFGTLEMPMTHLKRVAMMRGPGWSILYYDPEAHTFHIGFSGEQHQGHFVTLPIILALDVWEHAYLVDYGTTGKAKYVDAFFENLNWEVIEKRYSDLA